MVDCALFNNGYLHWNLLFICDLHDWDVGSIAELLVNLYEVKLCREAGVGISRLRPKSKVFKLGVISNVIGGWVVHFLAEAFGELGLRLEWLSFRGV